MLPHLLGIKPSGPSEVALLDVDGKPVTGPLRLTVSYIYERNSE